MRVTFEELADSSAFPKLDRLIVSAASKVIRDHGGALAGKVGRLKDGAAERLITGDGLPLSGRQLQWLILNEFKGNAGAETSNAYEDLLGLRCAGWKDVPRFLNDWDNVLAKSKTPFPPSLLVTRFKTETRKISQFDDDYVIFDRKPVPERTYEFLRDAVDTFLLNHKHEEYRRIELAGPSTKALVSLETKPKGKAKAKPSPAGDTGQLTEAALAAHDESSVKICYAFRDNGNCTKRDCPYSHDPKAIRDAASNVGSNKSKGKGKGKSKGKGNKGKGSKSYKSSDASSTSPASSVSSLTKEQKALLPCHFVSTPKGCHRGAKCPFSHSAIAKATIAFALVSSFSSPVESRTVKPSVSFAPYSAWYHLQWYDEIGLRSPWQLMTAKDNLGCRGVDVPKWIKFRTGHKRGLTFDPIGLTTDSVVSSLNPDQTLYFELEAISKADKVAEFLGLKGSAVIASFAEGPIGDTGASMHLISPAEVARLGSETRISNNPIRLATAKGETTSKTEAEIKLSHFSNPLVHQVLPGTPHALSIGRLIEEEGCNQMWNRRDGFRIFNSEGNLIPTVVRNYVPIFLNSTESAFTAMPAEVPANPEPNEPIEIAANPEAEPNVTLAKLKAVATSVQHLLTHLPFNAECASCVQGRSKHAYALRSNPEHKAGQNAEAMRF